MANNKKLIWIFAIIIIYVYTMAEDTKKEATGCTTGNCIDLSSTAGVINLHYGINEDDSWETFANNPTYQDYHRQLNSEYMRVWLSAQHYRQSTFPLQSDGSYDWTYVDQFINAALDSETIPQIVFAHGDRCGVREEFTAPFDFSNCQGHGSVPPSNMDEFVDYVDTVVTRFRDMCNAGSYSKSCDANDWYYEVWNEPTGDIWWDGTYYSMYNLVDPRIRSIVPGAKVGGYGSSLSSQTNADFRVRHLYANIEGASSDQERMDVVRDLFFNAIGSLPILNNEYNTDWGSDLFDDQFTASWNAASLINQIKAGIHHEYYYKGTASGNSGNRGMWSKSGSLYPVFFMKKQFTLSHPTGSTYFDDTVDFSQFDVLASANSGQNYITVVNKKGFSNSLNLQIKNAATASMTNIETSENHPIVSEMVSLSFSAYEVKFLQLDGGGAPVCSLSFNNYISYANSWVECNSPTCS
jgi:hypothetical protein